MFQEAQKEQKEVARGELNFFSLIEEEGERFKEPPDVPPPTKIDVLRREKELLGFYLTGHPLDDVRKIMQRLSCVSLQQIEKLEKGAVCRAGFVIEGITVRLTNKTGRKFAILTIGDNDHRFELPIWSELYEEKGHLLIENQLLYAVLQVGRDEDGTIRLQCRWFDDLTKADEMMIKECDAAYDKARMQAKMSALRAQNPKRKAAAEKKPSKEEKLRTLILRVDADKTHLSQVLQLKKMFRDSSGKSPVEIEFISQNKPVGKISIDESWGVELTESLKSGLESLPVIIDILAESR